MSESREILKNFIRQELSKKVQMAPPTGAVLSNNGDGTISVSLPGGAVVQAASPYNVVRGADVVVFGASGAYVAYPTRPAVPAPNFQQGNMYQSGTTQATCRVAATTALVSPANVAIILQDQGNSDVFVIDTGLDLATYPIPFNSVHAAISPDNKYVAMGMESADLQTFRLKCYQIGTKLTVAGNYNLGEKVYYATASLVQDVTWQPYVDVAPDISNPGIFDIQVDTSGNILWMPVWLDNTGTVFPTKICRNGFANQIASLDWNTANSFRSIQIFDYTALQAFAIDWLSTFDPNIVTDDTTSVFADTDSWSAGGNVFRSSKYITTSWVNGAQTLLYVTLKTLSGSVIEELVYTNGSSMGTINLTNPDSVPSCFAFTLYMTKESLRVAIAGTVLGGGDTLWHVYPITRAGSNLTANVAGAQTVSPLSTHPTAFRITDKVELPDIYAWGIEAANLPEA